MFYISDVSGRISVNIWYIEKGTQWKKIKKKKHSVKCPLCLPSDTCIKRACNLVPNEENVGRYILTPFRGREFLIQVDISTTRENFLEISSLFLIELKLCV